MTYSSPIQQQLDNARSHCQDSLQRAIVEIIADYATNPFIIYRQDYLDEPKLAAKLRRQDFQFSDQQLEKTLQTMIEHGVLKRRRSLFSPPSYSVTAAAIARPAQ
jgi:hypothetical protein